ncbi:MAG: hypothetical protein ACP5QW_01800, partial [bacterium]
MTKEIKQNSSPFKDNQNSKVICVLGMHRSGTSAMMGMLQNMGLDLGTNLMGPAEDNPKGFFENENVTFLNDKI